MPLVDKQGRIFAVLAGRPTGSSYLAACDAVYNLLEIEGKNAPFTPKELSHRRGDYPALNVGVTHGMGTLRPTLLDTRPHTALVDRLLNNRHVKRIAAYGSGRTVFLRRSFVSHASITQLHLHSGIQEHTTTIGLVSTNFFHTQHIHTFPDYFPNRSSPPLRSTLALMYPLASTTTARTTPRAGAQSLPWALSTQKLEGI